VNTHDHTPIVGVGGFTLAEALAVFDGMLGRVVLLATLGYTLTKWALLWRHRNKIPRE